jgi:hypothetical protein
MAQPLREAARAVIRVGDGRGFIVDGKEGRLVITAAHCLPSSPQGFSIASFNERTYQALLGPAKGQMSGRNVALSI